MLLIQQLIFLADYTETAYCWHFIKVRYHCCCWYFILQNTCVIVELTTCFSRSSSTNTNIWYVMLSVPVNSSFDYMNTSESDQRLGQWCETVWTAIDSDVVYCTLGWVAIGYHLTIRHPYVQRLIDDEWVQNTTWINLRYKFDNVQ